MDPAPSSFPGPPPAESSRSRRWRKCLLALLLGVGLTYLIVAYLLMPTFRKRYTHRHPSLEDIPNVTHTNGRLFVGVITS